MLDILLYMVLAVLGFFLVSVIIFGVFLYVIIFVVATAEHTAARLFGRHD